MFPEEKIARVLQHIKNEMLINPNPKMIGFKFNDHVVGFGIVIGEDERKILLKLNSEKIIKLKIPENKEAIYKYNYKLEEYIFMLPLIIVEITDGFENYFKKYEKYLRNKTVKNYWNYINPFYLIWMLLTLVWKFFKIVWRYKIVSLIITTIPALITISTSDYSKIRENINKLKNYVLIK